MNNLALLQRQQTLFEKRLKVIYYGGKEETFCFVKSTKMPSMNTIYSYGSLSSIDEESDIEDDDIEVNSSKTNIKTLGFMPRKNVDYGKTSLDQTQSLSNNRNNSNNTTDGTTLLNMRNHPWYFKYVIYIICQSCMILLTSCVFSYVQMLHLESFATIDVRYASLYSSIKVEAVMPIVHNITISNHEMIINSTLHKGNYCYLNSVTTRCNLNIHYDTNKLYLKTDEVRFSSKKENNLVRTRRYLQNDANNKKHHQQLKEQKVLLHFRPNDVTKLLFILTNFIIFIIFINLIIVLSV